MTGQQAQPVFSGLRPQLVRIAYRMLGSVTDAEDVVQEAWLRWLDCDRDAVREPAAFLRTVVTRLCLNELNSARRRRETYVGSWLPEPVFDPEDGERADDLTLPLMIVLERLSPLERAAFLLHDVFGMSFNDISDAIGRDETACRKLASRARSHIHEARPRFAASREQGLELAAAFYSATRNGDMQALRSLLAEDITACSDGGGKVSALIRPAIGLEAVMKLFQGLARYFARSPSELIRYAVIDGLPGFLTLEAEGVLQTTALQIENGKITAVYVTRNPDKLQRLPEHHA